MPRSSAYFGSIASGSPTYAAPVQAPALQRYMGPVSQFAGQIASAFTKPKIDPVKEAQIGLYDAQAAGERYKTYAANQEDLRAQSARDIMAEQVRQVRVHLDSIPPEERTAFMRNFALEQYEQAIRSGLKQNEASEVARGIVNMIDPSGELAPALITAASGNAAAANSYFNIAQEGMQAERRADEAAAHDERDNAGRLAVQTEKNKADFYAADQRLAGDKYSANASAGASRYGSDRQYAASTENSKRSDATERYKFDEGRKPKPPTTKTVNKVTTVTKGPGGPPPASPLAQVFANPQPQPKPAVQTPTLPGGRRIRFDAQGNPIQ